ncbi:CFI-box-CTERM domain-containing protein [Natronoglomus mannanivorans]|uniref:Uncharacterized protein n=1 Tax=Natronoglomus mannanivorans TaxID=2979990 RepID=A0AAP3E389_9EURY|nr:hypothetical protein [Halobacteria archaeon AArc-xg1-1]
MSLTRRALLSLAGSVGLAGAATATGETEEEDDIDLSYGAVPYGEQGYGGSRSDCFIATAAIGTTNHEDVAALRRFRDDVLLENAVGRAFVRTYYATSPPVARWIARGPRRRRIVRRTLIEPASRLAQVR